VRAAQLADTAATQANLGPCVVWRSHVHKRGRHDLTISELGNAVLASNVNSVQRLKETHHVIRDDQAPPGRGHLVTQHREQPPEQRASQAGRDYDVGAVDPQAGIAHQLVPGHVVRNPARATDTLNSACARPVLAGQRVLSGL